MILLLSPAKIQNSTPELNFTAHSQPEFLNQAAFLVSELQKLNTSDLSKLLGINAQLALRNEDRYFNWQLPFHLQNSKQTVLTFNGEVYHGLDAHSFTPDDMHYAQSHLRILSGLYGLLRPLDLMQPYRLEISSKLSNPKGSSLYDFWKEEVTKSLNFALSQLHEKRVLLNLASAEYFKVINVKAVDADVIDVEFLQYKEDGGTRAVVMYTKKARGLMARYVIINRIESVDALKGFSDDNYWYNEALSTETKMVFVR